MHLHRDSDKIKLQRGVRQGDKISPKLFTACLQDAIINKIKWEDTGINLSHLIFADDIVLVAKSSEELESMLNDIHLVSKPVGLSMNLSETKMMLNESATTSTVAVDGNTIEKVDRYVYLGKTVTQAGDLLPEIKRRIALGWAAFGKVANIMKSRKASMNVKRKVHNEYVLQVMVYGSETWVLKKAHMELLSVAQRKMERIMLGITLSVHTRNTWIRHQTGVNYSIDVIKKGIHGWAGHIARFKDNRWTNRVTEWTPREWTRRPGRPKTRWRDSLIRHLGPECPRIARARLLWRPASVFLFPLDECILVSETFVGAGSATAPLD